jgi:hypothetical protein
MEPEVSLTCSQQPASGPYPEPEDSNPFLYDAFQYEAIPSSTPEFSKWSLPFRFSYWNYVQISILSHAC